MIKSTSSGGHIAYNLQEFILDLEEDFKQFIVSDEDNNPTGVEKIPMGSTAFVLETKKAYVMGSIKDYSKIGTDEFTPACLGWVEI